MYIASVSYRTDRNSKWSGAYDVSLTNVEDLAPWNREGVETRHPHGRLESRRGPVEDNIAPSSTGLFAKRDEAVRAIMEYIPANGHLVLVTTWGNSPSVQFRPLGKGPQNRHGVTEELLATRSNHGLYIAN